MNKLTPEQLVLLNKKLVGEEKQQLLRVDNDELTEITEIPFQTDRDFYRYRRTKEKAAKLAIIIVKRKPFLEANRETAVLSMLTLLLINGIKLVEYSEDVEELYKYLEEAETDEVCNWIDSHLAGNKK